MFRFHSVNKIVQMKHLAWVIILLACLSCSKEEPQFLISEPAVTCDKSTIATVEFMTASVSGVDDFYYLRVVDEQNGKEELVYPQKLNESYKVSGTKIKLNFAFTAEVYDYIICLPGHQIDANNPDVSDMRIISICEAEKKT